MAKAKHKNPGARPVGRPRVNRNADATCCAANPVRSNLKLAHQVRDLIDSIPRLTIPNQAAVIKARLKESGVAYTNPDTGTDYDDKYYVALGDASPLDLPAEIQMQAARIAFWVYRKNPRAWSAIELVKDFVIGDGFAVSAEDGDVKKMLDRFVEANQFNAERLDERLRAWAIFGEQLYPAFVAKGGLVRISSVSPQRIVDAKRNAENAEEVDIIRCAFTNATAVDMKNFNVIYQNIDESWRVLENPAFYFPVNRINGGARGVPDLLSALDWLDGMDQFIFSVLERADAASSIVFDAEYDGLSPEEIKKKVDELTKYLRDGGVYGHNKGATLTIKTPSFGAFESDKVASMILKQIHAGGRMGGLFYGDSADLTRASASELSIPVAKMIQGRQRSFKNMLKTMFKFQIAEGKKSGAIKPTADESFTIELARVYLRDMSTITKALVEIGTALTNAVAGQWLSISEAAAIFRGAVKELGIQLTEFDSDSIDLDSDTKEIYDAAKKADKEPGAGAGAKDGARDKGGAGAGGAD